MERPMVQNMATGEPLRVVLDTNVLLSLWAFVDSRFAPLRREVDDGRWIVLTNEACLAEYRRVLNYPQLKLDATTQHEAYQRYVDVAVCVTAVAGHAAAPLPRCQDRDDQKFLELARDGRAHWLLTADKALLKLARRNALHGLFGIATPEVALAALTAP
jgi:uncharacterized protein